MYEVAKLADVSIATVSRVVNTDSRVKEKTRQKVLSAMLSLGYQPNSIAQFARDTHLQQRRRAGFRAARRLLRRNAQCDRGDVACRRQVRARRHRPQQGGAGARGHQVPRQPQLRRVDRACRGAARQIPRRAQQDFDTAGRRQSQSTGHRRSMLQSRQRARRLSRGTVAVAAQAPKNRLYLRTARLGRRPAASEGS